VSDIVALNQIALGHEMLHTFGYGHSREMDRLSQDVDDQMARFQT